MYTHILTSHLYSKDTLNDNSIGIVATRVYVILVAISISIVMLYLSIGTNTNSVTVHNPSLDKFEMLHAAHSETLSCPCSEISVSISDVVTRLAPIFHQVYAKPQDQT